MASAIAEWKVAMEKLEAEERALRDRLKTIESQKDYGSCDKDVSGGDCVSATASNEEAASPVSITQSKCIESHEVKDSLSNVQHAEQEDSESEDEFEDAVSVAASLHTEEINVESQLNGQQQQLISEEIDSFHNSEPSTPTILEQDVTPRANSPVLPQLEESPASSLHEPTNHLPDEIILEITAYVARGARSQQALATCCLLSRKWYDASISLLYHKPRLYGRNFDLFVRSICPSKNLHVRRSPLAELVRVLDMSKLIHESSKSTTARLLGRTKEGLEEYVAPQSSFGLNCMPALAKCLRLQVLDLSLVSESPSLPELFKSISHLTTLRTLRLPRSTGFGVHHKKSNFTNSWPPNITDLTLSGGIDAHFLHGVASFPLTLKHLTIEHCPLAKSHAITHLLKTAVAPLEKLESIKIAHMPRLSFHALDGILFILPQISRLSVSVDYITPAVFDEGHFHHSHSKADDECPTLQHSNLRTLELTNSESMSVAANGGISPADVHLAILDGALPKLRQVRVAQSLGWLNAASADETEELVDALQDGAKADWMEREWIFRDMRKVEYETERCWERSSGVWVFEG